MRTNRMHQARMGALLFGTAATLAACTPRDSDTAAADTGMAATTAAGATAGTAGAAGTVAGDSAAMAGTAGTAGGAMSESAIMGTINTSNAAEIGTSELAQERGANAEVKRFATDMIREHRQMQKEGDQLAQRLKITAQPGAQADQMQQMMTATVDTLKALRGAEFDQRYMAFQVQSHQTTLDNLRRFENQAQNADLKAMITKAIPAVQGHLERAQRIQSGLGGAATKS